MYLCHNCGKSSQPGEPQNKVVSETRKKTYTNRDGKMSHGYETVSEAALCNKCAAQVQPGTEVEKK